MVACDLRRGGCVTLTEPKILHSRFTFFKVRDYSPNQCRLIVRDFYRDRMVNPDNYFTLFEYAGDENNKGEWHLYASGWIPVHQAPFDKTRLFKVPANFPRAKFKTDLTYSGVPK
jgi:hypothetical protein